MAVFPMVLYNMLCIINTMKVRKFSTLHVDLYIMLWQLCYYIQSNLLLLLTSSVLSPICVTRSVIEPDSRDKMSVRPALAMLKGVSLEC